MKRSRAALFGLLLLPLTGCVFAMGVDGDETEALRDRVRELERRLDRIERPHWGQPETVVIRGDSVEAPKSPLVPTIQKDEK